MKSFSRILLVFLTFTFLYPATPDQEVQTEEAIRSFSEQLVLQMLEYRNEMIRSGRSEAFVSNLTSSAPGSNVTIQGDVSPEFNVAGTEAAAFVSMDDQATWNTGPCAELGTPGYENTWECNVATEGGTFMDWYLQLTYNDTVDATGEIRPIIATQSPYNEGLVFPPDQSLMALLAEDPAGDQDAGGPDVVDITHIRGSYNADSLYVQMQTAGAGYPLYSDNPFLGPFYLYGIGLFNPDEFFVSDVVTIYAVGFALGLFGNLHPGVLKVQATTSGEIIGFDTSGGLSQLYVLENGNDSVSMFTGDISIGVRDDLLTFALALDPIVNDEDFGVWPNTSNGIVAMGLTAQVDLDINTIFFDSANPGILILETQSQDGNLDPVLSGAGFNDVQNQLTVAYADADGNLPTLKDVSTLQRESGEMTPLSHTYLEGADFYYDLTSPEPGLHTATFSFEDGAGSDAVDLTYGIAPDPGDFTYSGTLTARVHIDGTTVGSINSYLAAYSGGEVRGVASGTYYSAGDYYVFQMDLFGNAASGDMLTFKYYDATDDELFDPEETLEFTSGMYEGTDDVPFDIFIIVYLPGCVDSNACNFSPDATDDDGSCTYPDEFYDCAGDCLNDTDSDLVCDELEVPGCMDDTACNYDESATDENSSCWYAEEFLDCAGDCLNDSDGDLVCDELEVSGCTDDTACNYDVNATEEYNSCWYAEEFLDCAGDCLNDTDGDLVCDELEVSGCTDDTACNYDVNATEEDNSCWYAEEFLDCEGNCLNDADGDLVCDEQEIAGCTEEGACNYNAEATDDDGSCFYECLGCIDESACNFDPDASVDDGSCVYAEEFHDCAGNCLNDADGDQVCDEQEVLGCTNPVACNYNPGATENDGSCWFFEQYYDCEGNCVIDTDGDGVCNQLEVSGCDDDSACNFEEGATDNDGSCEYPDEFYDCEGSCVNDVDGDLICDELEIQGCQDADACNFNPDATDEDGSCWYADEFYDCAGDCLNDTDGDGVCDELEVPGCMDESACNFDIVATDPDDSCWYADDFYDCAGDCLNDTDGDLVCDELEVLGCTDDTACNFDAEATDDDASCWYAEDYYDCEGDCVLDTDGDGVCDQSEVPGCDDDSACNFDAEATDNDGSCEYPDEYYDCEGNCVNDTDGDLVCDELEIAGCMDETACNFNDSATDEDGSCFYPTEILDCNGDCFNDADGDGVCDELEIPGCTDELACNFDETATDENMSCNYDCYGCTDDSACNFDPEATINDDSCSYPEAYYNCEGSCLNDTDGDLICDELEVSGCTDDTACNYDAEVTDDDNSCWYAEDYYDCAGDCLTDTDADGVCDELEIPGCDDEPACNYNPEATDNDNSCVYPVPPFDCFGECLNDVDGDGVCDELEIPGCTDEEACNYEFYASDDDGSCQYPDAGLDCDGNCLNDADQDGICDEDEIPGCTDEEACNYDAEATDDDGSCEYGEAFYDCEGNCLNDQDNDGICDELEIEGCTDPAAMNYNPGVSVDDGSCMFTGDFNGDGTVNVLDIVQIVDLILFSGSPTEYQLLVADLNGDGFINVLDLVIIVEIILQSPVLSRYETVDTVSLMISSNSMGLIADGDVAGFQLKTSGNYRITAAYLPDGWTWYAENDMILAISLDGSTLSEKSLFSFTGDLSVSESLFADWNGSGVMAQITELPDVFSVMNAYPNPFNPLTTIAFELPVDSQVDLKAYNVLGAEVAVLAEGYLAGGVHSINWNAGNLPSGLYVIRLTAGEYSHTQKVLLAK